MHFPLFPPYFLISRSCWRSKKLKSVLLHPHPSDACAGPAPAALAMPSLTSMASEHSSCLGETCGQNHLLPQQEHFHQIVTNINTKDCNKNKQTQKKKKKDTHPASPLKINKANQSKGLSGEEIMLPARHWASGCPELCPPGCQIKDLGLFFHPHTLSDSSFFFPKMCATAGEGGAGWVGVCSCMVSQRASLAQEHTWYGRHLCSLRLFIILFLYFLPLTIYLRAKRIPVWGKGWIGNVFLGHVPSFFLNPLWAVLRGWQYQPQVCLRSSHTTHKSAIFVTCDFVAFWL